MELTWSGEREPWKLGRFIDPSSLTLRRLRGSLSEGRKGLILHIGSALQIGGKVRCRATISSSPRQAESLAYFARINNQYDAENLKGRTMSTNASTDVNGNKDGMADVTISPTGMHRPGHGASDSEGTACLDEIQHEAALRESILRVPR